MAGDDAQEPIDLRARVGTGPLWGLASTDLNATLLAWPPGHELPEHVNAELDVLLIVLEGNGSAIVDGVSRDVASGHAMLIPRGARRRIVAGDGGLRYLSVHRRRGPLQIEVTHATVSSASAERSAPVQKPPGSRTT